MTAMPDTFPDDDWLSKLDADQVAAVLEKSVRWVREKWASGELPITYKVGRTRYTSSRDLQDYIRRTKRQGQ